MTGLPRWGWRNWIWPTAGGRVLAAPITAPEDVPGFLRATMDGYAVRARDTFGASVGAPQYLEIKGEVPMGVAPTRGVGPGETLRVATGAMLPPGADAVVMIEYTAEHPDGTLEVRRAVAPGESLLSPGEDVARGERLFPAGRRLRPQEIGLLAALGIRRLAAYKKPRVAIISSGDEIVPLDEKPRPGQVRDSNAYLAAAQVAEWGGLPLMHGIIPDDFDALRNTLAAALDRGGPDSDLRRQLRGRPGPDPDRHPGPARLRDSGARGGAPARQTHHPGGPGANAFQAPHGAAGAPGLRRGGHGGAGPAAAAAPGGR